MDQFSHDLTVALEETSLLDRAKVSRWGQQRRRTRSTGNLPCAPQPTEDSSSPTDAALGASVQTATNNNDGLDTVNVNLPSDSDDKEELGVPRLACKSLSTARVLGTLESDSLNETFSPARFFKPSARRKRKLKRISMDYEVIGAGSTSQVPEPSVSTLSLAPNNTSTGCPGTLSMRKRGLKPEVNSRQMFFCGKRKRSNRDRYQEHDHSSSMPRHNSHLEEYSMRPRSFSSTSKPHSDRLLPLNKGLLSKIERISQQQQKTEAAKTSQFEQMEKESFITTVSVADSKINDAIEDIGNESTILDASSTFNLSPDASGSMIAEQIFGPGKESSFLLSNVMSQQQDTNFQNHRKKRSAGHHHRRRLLQFSVDQNSMDCEDFNSSSSLSSSDSDDHAVNDTDREGDDELTDWPGNETLCGESKYDTKRKLTKRNTLPQIKSDPESVGSLQIGEDDTVMSNNTTVGENTSLNFPPSADSNRGVVTELPYQSSEPINIASKIGFSSLCRSDVVSDDVTVPIKQIESEMSGETSNPFLSSPPCQPSEVREIRAGCRRVKGERPGFSIKTSVNERLARFLQDPRQLQIRLPDVEIYEHESLLNLAQLYSLQMSLDNGCAVLNKTSKTTQSVNIEQQSLQDGLFLSDFKRRCYDSNEAELLHNK
ncbi:uncharacterized protein LOC101889117 [Musca domestica]|uniref:Uncharacterized protein LOC101889117 n=1 Tax=Musca domestica TaxID=7370 RepID=A0A9J7CNG6_MUSDO|nr:uncharacterized protein LOC101889117 [Musca domestica]